LDLIRHNPHLDRKIGLPRSSGMKGLRTLLHDLRREHYDLVYDAHRSLRTRYLMPRLRAPYKARVPKGYLKRDLALTFKLPLLDETRRTLERAIDPLERYGVRYDGLGPEMFVDEATRARALQKVPLPPAEPGASRIAIIASAQWPGKRWPLDRFREVIEKLVNETPHLCVVLGGPADTFCRDLCAEFPQTRVVNAQGKLSLLESAALLERCGLAIANDTGLMHVADALGVPSVLLFGPTSAELGCLPFHPATRVVEQAMWCRPCSKNGQAPCIRKERYCLTRITTANVFDETLTLVREISKEASS
jgi:ADP-heptose:LPS heptosyltransferase